MLIDLVRGESRLGRPGGSTSRCPSPTRMTCSSALRREHEPGIDFAHLLIGAFPGLDLPAEPLAERTERIRCEISLPILEPRSSVHRLRQFDDALRHHRMEPL